jgi:PKD repeat protein
LAIAAPGLLANDSDADGNPLTAALDSGPASGTLSLAATGAFVYTPGAGFLGTDSFTYRASDGQALSEPATVLLVVTTANAAPIVSLNPTGPVNEGSALVVSGSFTDVDGSGPWTATVDFGDGSGLQPVALAADQTFAVSHVYRDNGSFAVTVSVTDAGGASGAANLAAPIVNVAPQNLAFAGPAAGSRGQTLNFTGSFTDPGLNDTHTARIDWGDGSISSPVVTGSGSAFRQLAATHTYQTSGTYQATLTVSDDDGGSASRQIEVVVQTAQVPGVALRNGLLEIVGSEQSDSITVAVVQGGGLNVFGSLGGATVSQSFAAGSVLQIVAQMGGGSDMLTISSTVPLPVFADGGAGSDTLLAGGGAAILLGGPGNDSLRGGTRRDLLIGGVGLDQINAAGASDLLIGGRTAYDADQAALAAILAEWTAAGGYQDRAARLRGGTGTIVQPLGVKLTHNQTVFDDTVVDRLWGGSEMDWFFYDPTRDQALDKLASEINR